MCYRAPAAVWTTSHTTNTWFHVLTYYFQTVFRGTVKCRWSNFFIYDSLKPTNLQDTTIHYALINLTFEILTRSPETIHETIYLWADCWPRPSEKPSARPLWSSTAQCIKHRPQNNILWYVCCMQDISHVFWVKFIKLLRMSGPDWDQIGSAAAAVASRRRS